jgi:hypothetical protein
LSGGDSNGIISTRRTAKSGYNLAISDATGNGTSCNVCNSSTCAGSGSTKIVLYNWYHVMCAYNGTTMKMYINGILNKTNTINITIAYSSTTNLTIAQFYAVNDGSTNLFNGTIDDVMVFKRALNLNEIQALYANTSSRYLGVNFTGLNDGDYNYKAYTQNILGNVENTETRQITISP